MKPMRLATTLLSSKAARRVFSVLTRDRVTVFNLHRVNEPGHGVHGHDLTFIADAIDALKRSGATFVSLRDILEARQQGLPTDGKWVAFSVDDGFEDQYVMAKNVFLPRRCPLTVFVITDFLDGRIWPWDDRLALAFRLAPAGRRRLRLGDAEMELNLMGSASRSEGLRAVRKWCKSCAGDDLYKYVDDIASQLEVQLPEKPPQEFSSMTWEQARELESLGVQFGVHSMTHRIISRLKPEAACWELEQSWARLRAELRNPLPVLAWPTGLPGDYSERDEQLAKRLGLLMAYSTVGDYSLLNDERLFTLARFGLPTDITRVLQYGSWIERAKQIVRLQA
jgi:peptidoglycan/xylan/chitin deacetylase (PgdA/CDA1 family)